MSVRRDYLEALLIRREQLKAAPVAAGQGARSWLPTNSVVVALAKAPNARGIVTRDAHRCAGCRRCEIVCSIANVGAINPASSRIQAARQSNGSLFPETCLRCEDPVPCLAACPLSPTELSLAGAAARASVEKACADCRRCEEACPPRTLSLDAATMAAMECHLCSGSPECVKECPLGALTYVPAVGPGTQPARRN